MATSFLPNTEDASSNIIPSETLSQVPNSELENSETVMESIPESPLPVEALEGHPAENEHFLEESNDTSETNAPTPVAVVKQQSQAPVKPIPQIRNDLTIQIEKIMEEDLGDVFMALTPVQKQQFKIKGEETSKKIYHIIQTTTVKLGRIVKLIFDWLKILPGVNHFFLEQEAKIKAEKIIALSEQKKHI